MSRRATRGPVLALIAAVIGVSTLAACTMTRATASPSLPLLGPAPLSIKVSGNHFVDQNGAVVQLRGVNRPGTEYRCEQSQAPGFISDSGTGAEGETLAYADTVVDALKSWNLLPTPNAINAVRIPLNEDCWLGINGAPAAFSGTAYQAFIQREVTDLTAAGMYSILDLHWSAPGAYPAVGQDVGPDADHAIAFWSQVAGVYKGQPSVMFDLYNEPRISCNVSSCDGSYDTAVTYAWTCYLNGCTYTDTPQDNLGAARSGTFQVAGTQALVDAIRSAGAPNVIIVEGLAYANDLYRWVSYKPHDPDANLAAEVHTYPSSGKTAENPADLDAMLASGGLSSAYPVYVGEFGEAICAGTTPTGFTQATMAWADQHGYSYTAWGWDSGEMCSGPSLVTDDDQGTTDAYGEIVKDHLQQLEVHALVP